MIGFVKSNLKPLLSLVAHDSTKNPDGFVISSGEFNCLRVLLKCDQNQSLSAIATELFPSTGVKAKSTETLDWITNNLNSKESSTIFIKVMCIQFSFCQNLLPF